MGAICPLDRRVTAHGELQSSAIPGPCHIVGLARLKTVFTTPALERGHSRRQLVQVDLHDTLEGRDAPLAPLIDAHGLQPAHPHEHVVDGLTV